MVGWHHRLNRHECEQTPVDNEGQESLVCCSLRGHRESDTTEQLNNNKSKYCQKQPEREIFQGKKTGMCLGN